MKEVSLLLVAVVLLPGIICPPVTVKPPAPAQEDPNVKPVQEDVNLGLEYERYLKEVVNVLETDPSFKKKLEETNMSDIKSGDIARHLDLVSHNVRTKLDELKRHEMERLRNIVRMQIRQRNGVKNIDPMRLVAHMDHSNPQTFEMSDLEKLIKQATVDLEKIDEERKEDFKKYEMEKEYLRKEKLKNLDEQAKLAEEAKFEEMKQKHKKHPKLHHPGSKDQLEEVWEEKDGLDPDNFDPKTFFKLHDANEDGYLDQWEIEALFQTELDKAYDEDAPEDDMMERYEEMNRMREHVMKEVDEDKDSMISYEEFMKSTKGKDFEKDEGWDTLDNKELYTDEELDRFKQEYEMLRQQEIQQRQQQMAQGGHNNVPPVDPRMQRPPVPPHMQGQGQPPPVGGQPLQFQPGEGIPPAAVHQQQQQFMEEQQRKQMMAQQAAQQQQEQVHQQQQQQQLQQQQQQQQILQQQQQAAAAQQPPHQQQQVPVPVPQQQQPVLQEQQPAHPPEAQQPQVQPQQ